MRWRINNSQPCIGGNIASGRGNPAFEFIVAGMFGLIAPMEPSLPREEGGSGFGLDGVREFLEWDGHGMMARLRAVARCGAFLVSVRVTGAEGSAWMLCAAR